MPSPKQVTLGSMKAEYRDYLGYKVCTLDTKALTEDVDRVNGFLQQFLDAATAARSGTMTEEQQGMLENAPKALEPVLSAHGDVVKRVPACKELQGLPVLESAKKGQELVAETRKRLGEAPELLGYSKVMQEIRAWKEQQEVEQQNERANWCPVKPSKTPEIYYAWEDEQGTTEWLFCDGSKVVSAPGKEPEFIPSPDLNKVFARPPPASVYLTSAARFPSTEVRRAPKLPAAKKSSEGQGGAARPSP